MPQSSPRQIKMVFDLQTCGEAPLTPPGVKTCIEAMRGHGRCHTTRNFQPSRAWGIGEGDIAIAVGGQGEAVAFRVGQEYRITPAKARSDSYQQQWADKEKHSSKYLAALIRKNPNNLWGLEMEPLGDWIDGTIVPFSNDKTMVPEMTQAELLADGDRRQRSMENSTMNSAKSNQSSNSSQPLSQSSTNLAEPCPQNITRLKPHQIFVFGSNTQGRHGAYAAKQAMQFGAQYGNPKGLQGQSYAIVTKDLTKPKAQQSRSVSLAKIEDQIVRLCEYASNHPKNEFLVTKFGCGSAGYTESEIGSLWVGKSIPNNIRLPQDFIDVIQSAGRNTSSSQAEQAIVIACDGACSGNSGKSPGGWGAIVRYPNGKEVELGGYGLKTTNNRMELRGLIGGLKEVASNSEEARTYANHPIVVYSDSKYVIDGAKGDAARKANQDIWAEYDQLPNQQRVTFEWVKGHAGHELNERADRLAVKYRDQAIAQSDAASLSDRSSLVSSSYPVYLILVNDQLQIHSNWDDARKAVHGQPNAKYRKCRNGTEVEMLLQQWGREPEEGLRHHKPAPSKPYNPLAKLKPLNASVARNMGKDVAMAGVATQFIGKPATQKPSSTRNYEEAWTKLGLANTGEYSRLDVVMVSGNGPWRATEIEIKRTFREHYQPLLKQVVAAGAQVVVGNAKGTDQLVQGYLKKHGYRFSAHSDGYLQASPQAIQTHTPARRSPETRSEHGAAPSQVSPQATDSQPASSSESRPRVSSGLRSGLFQPAPSSDPRPRLSQPASSPQALKSAESGVLSDDLSPDDLKLVQEVLSTVQAGYQERKQSDGQNAQKKAISMPVGASCTAWICPGGDFTIRTAGRETAMAGNCETGDITYLSDGAAHKLRQPHQQPTRAQSQSHFSVNPSSSRSQSPDFER